MSRRIFCSTVFTAILVLILFLMAGCKKEELKEIRINNEFFSTIYKEDGTPEEYMQGWKSDVQNRKDPDKYGYISYSVEDNYTIVRQTDEQLSNCLSMDEEYLKDYQESFSKGSDYWLEYSDDYGIISYFIDLNVDLDDLQWSWKETWTSAATYRVFAGYEDNYKPIIRIVNCHTNKLVTESDSEGKISWEEEDWKRSEQ